jgi:hypothetical protein
MCAISALFWQSVEVKKGGDGTLASRPTRLAQRREAVEIFAGSW